VSTPLKEAPVGGGALSAGDPLNNLGISDFNKENRAPTVTACQLVCLYVSIRKPRAKPWGNDLRSVVLNVWETGLHLFHFKLMVQELFQLQTARQPTMCGVTIMCALSIYTVQVFEVKWRRDAFSTFCSDCLHTEPGTWSRGG
jgi:hypothetical protein